MHGLLVCLPIFIGGIIVSLIGFFGLINIFKYAGPVIIVVYIAAGITYPLLRLSKISKSMSGFEFDSVISDVMRIKKRISYFPTLVMTAEIQTNPCDIEDDGEENLYEDDD